MKKCLSFLLSLLMVFSLVACGALDTSEDATLDTAIEFVSNLNENAILILEQMTGTRLEDEDEFIDTVLAQVPDIFTLKEYRYADWTYFLVMEDGTEYVIFTNYDGKITSICEWFPESGECGFTIYEDYEE